MASLKDVKQQLREWELSHTTVFLSFSEYRQFSLHFLGRIGCGLNCGYFEAISHTPGSPRFSSPSLSAFKVVFLGPDPHHDNLRTIKLRHRRRPWEIELTEVGVQAEPTLEEIEAAAAAYVASRQRKRKPHVN